MAFSLKFMDEGGAIRRYHWYAYPMHVVRVLPEACQEWSSTNPPSIADIRTVSETVYCGPSAPLPAKPTADEFLDGVLVWLSR
jgi:hypothetical protein